MIKKHTILTLGLTIATSCFPEWSADHMNLAKKMGHDVVACKFTSKNDPKNISGSHALSFLALEALPSHRWYGILATCKPMYEEASAIASHKTEKVFFRCMANLDRPDIAVQNGEYKKCVKEAWAVRPWGAIDIRVEEKTRSNKTSSGESWKLEARSFSWYDPIKSLSFLD